jgi:hypothetical protein
VVDFPENLLSRRIVEESRRLADNEDKIRIFAQKALLRGAISLREPNDETEKIIIKNSGHG